VTAARYQSAVRVVMKSALQLDPSLDVLGNRLPNEFIQRSKDGQSLFTEQTERLAPRAPMAMRPAMLTCRPTPPGGTRNPRHRRSGRRCSY
jgi:hypothetical protein